MSGPSTAVQLSPSSCCIRRSSCVGLRSPSERVNESVKASLLGKTGPLD